MDGEPRVLLIFSFMSYCNAEHIFLFAVDVQVLEYLLFGQFVDFVEVFVGKW